jgi:hypothetical protein
MNRSRALVWGVLAALALPVLGCGDDDGGDGGGEGASRELEQLVSALEKVTNSPTRANIDVDIEGGRETFSMDGQMESLRDEARLEVDFEQGGQAIPMEIVQHEKAAWMRSPSLQSLMPPGKTWIKTTDPEVVGGGTLTPAQFGELIEDAGEVENLGRERVDGTPTRLLKAVVDVSDLAAKAGRSTAGFLGGVDADDVEVPLHVWLGPDGKPVRMFLEIFLPQEAGGGRVAMNMDEFEYDVPVDTAAPPANTVTDDSVLE